MNKDTQAAGAATLTDAQIIDLADDFKSQYQHGGTTFDEFDALGFGKALLSRTSQMPTVTDHMVSAYLKANDEYWRRTDELPGRADKWRKGTPQEATRESLIAALASTATAPSAPASPAPSSVSAEQRGYGNLRPNGDSGRGDLSPDDDCTPPAPAAAPQAGEPVAAFRALLRAEIDATIDVSGDVARQEAQIDEADHLLVKFNELFPEAS